MRDFLNLRHFRLEVLKEMGENDTVSRGKFVEYYGKAFHLADDAAFKSAIDRPI